VSKLISCNKLCNTTACMIISHAAVIIITCTSTEIQGNGSKTTLKTPQDWTRIWRVKENTLVCRTHADTMRHSNTDKTKWHVIWKANSHGDNTRNDPMAFGILDKYCTSIQVILKTAIDKCSNSLTRASHMLWYLLFSLRMLNTNMVTSWYNQTLQPGRRVEPTPFSHTQVKRSRIYASRYLNPVWDISRSMCNEGGHAPLWHLLLEEDIRGRKTWEGLVAGQGNTG